MKMNEYHKIQSVYLRDPANRHKTFLDGQWSMPEFGYLAGNEWIWTEKVDGTNVRVHWDGEKVTIGGRTKDAQMPLFLVYRLEALFPRVLFQTHFPESSDVLLFGEGYGAKIQKAGGNYNPAGVDFALFDVMIGGIFLERSNVEDIASKMTIGIVPVVGKGTILDAIDATRFGQVSQWGAFTSEGLVLRPLVELMTRNGHRVITKVKHRDFVK